ncbi:MAG: CPBP family intramembrane metalloprotease [Gammaproteobacteria bacterium]|nr:CPBP family intramembrane metalloprotease [Gammaproteobacteria bacterium]
MPQFSRRRSYSGRCTSSGGAGGVPVTTIMGAVWGFAYLLCGRNLWIVILAHSMAHIALVTQLYALPPA